MIEIKVNSAAKRNGRRWQNQKKKKWKRKAWRGVKMASIEKRKSINGSSEKNINKHITRAQNVEKWRGIFGVAKAGKVARHHRKGGREKSRRVTWIFKFDGGVKKKSMARKAWRGGGGASSRQKINRKRISVTSSVIDIASKAAENVACEQTCKAT